MAGTIMPENARFRSIFVEKVEDIALVLLLPLFFVFTGLRTQIGLLNDIYLWKITGLIILVAVTGKFLDSALAAKYVGQNWKDSLTIGALMNTRGLMELVVLALLTTFITGPALDLINWFSSRRKVLLEKAVQEISITFYFPSAIRSRQSRCCGWHTYWLKNLSTMLR